MSDSPIQQGRSRPEKIDEAPDPIPAAMPAITGGVWVPRGVFTVGIFAMVVLGLSLAWWLNHRTERAEQGRLEALERVEEITRLHGEELRKRDRLHEQERIQWEREQEIDRENRQNERAKRDEAEDELRRERNMLEFEIARLRQQMAQQPKRIITVR